MKKILVLVIAMSLLFGVVGVMAVGPTDLNANVCSSIISAAVTPTVNFGSVFPGKTYTGSQITITPTNPDATTMKVKVSVSDVIGTLFKNNLMLEGVDPLITTKSWTFTCSIDSNCGCTWALPSDNTTPTLIVPGNFLGAGLQTGTITYLVTDGSA